jgi:hypothetical protein
LAVPGFRTVETYAIDAAPPQRTMHRTRCPPCRGYTPELASSYTSIVAMGKSFEIVFVSSDQDEPAFQSYFAEMPWLALPFADRLTKQALSDKFDIKVANLLCVCVMVVVVGGGRVGG